MGLINSRESNKGPQLLHSPETTHESRPLLGPYSNQDYGGLPRPFPTAPVTALVKEARYAIINAVDTSLTWDELGSSEIYLALLLPIVRKYREEKKETAAAYCFLLNHWQFLKDAASDLANARLNETRVLKAFSMRQLIDVLTNDFSPIRRKDARSRLYLPLPHFEGEPSTEPMNAIEVAILGRAKHFLSNPLVQEIINQIWLGQIVFFSNAIDNPESCLNASQQEIRTVTVYDTRDIKFLRLSRLRVPRYKTTFQMISFSVFISIYTAVTLEKEAGLTALEVIMDIFALSYALDEFLQLKDSGPSFYFETVWNLFDVPIYIIFLLFISLRISTFFTGTIEMSDFAYDVLACNAILLWPRLFAVFDHYRFFGTMLIVLRQMLLDAMLFLALSLIFYVGFLQAFYTLHDNTKSYGEIAWLLLQVFLGSAFLGFEEAPELSKLFGTPLMVLFVAISVLMLYTLLISIFSQTFVEVSANAKEEFMFLLSVKVMEEVKSDALYEFQPPFNILAGIFVWPCSLLYPSDAVGRLSRALLRVFYFLELVFIWLFEVLIMQKRPPFAPARSNTLHPSRYGTAYGATLPIGTGIGTGNSTVGGGVAKRRHEQINRFNAVGKSMPDDASSSESYGANVAKAVDYPVDRGRRSSMIIAGAASQQLAHLNIHGLDGSNTKGEVLSPYLENIMRFRDASKSNSTSSPLKNDSEDHQDRSQFSFHPVAPFGRRVGIGRYGSVSGYGGPYHGAEATLASTFRGTWPSPMGENISGDPYYQSNQSGHHPNQQEQELPRLIEERFAEIRIRMDTIESKLDRLISAILGKDPDDQ
ncbi:hypothetical protein BG011_007449 [Mortierella polycephala]|uniref:Ion transport domain-containing protein n=1 Tax=Mortierella polycephala TaxID=41804 RepID=A0A9P6TY66_9FUNG|nr:hypothetical protein BG011_007449 [Mortierella polycephala]